jgi:anti-sigma B factor antagonist
MEAALTPHERPTVMDELDGTETFDSTGLEALLGTLEALQALGGDLKIASRNPLNRKVLEITRLDQQLEVFDSVLEAVKSFA